MADSDSDFDSDSEANKLLNKRKQPSTWIEEDPESIIDFTDPTVVSKITGIYHYLVLKFLIKQINSDEAWK